MLPEWVKRRAGGRRRYLRERRERRAVRLHKLAKLRLRAPGLTQAAFAAALGVARSTVYRDLRLLRVFGGAGGCCPLCGRAWSAVALEPGRPCRARRKRAGVDHE